MVRLAFRGDRFYCPRRDSSFRRFRSFNGPDRACWACGSLERHRLAWLYMDQHPEMLLDATNVLDIAPENTLRNRLKAIPGVNYHGGDLSAEFGPERIDVTDLEFEDDSMDIVLCNHVLEHVPDDHKAMKEIARVLRPNGWAMLLVPDLEEGLAAQTTVEDPTVTDPRDRERLFGQDDHVRRYGWDYLERLADAGFSAHVVRPADTFSSGLIERCRLTKRGHLEPLVFGRLSTG